MIKKTVITILLIIATLLVGDRIFNEGHAYTGFIYIVVVLYIIYRVYIKKKVINK